MFGFCDVKSMYKKKFMWFVELKLNCFKILNKN